MELSSPTVRLDLADPLLDRFVARVVSVLPLENGLGDVVLDRTAFYPESGGQGADHGQLGEATVVFVRADARGLVRHTVRGPLPSPSTELEGLIDMGRRRDFMAQHTGQHLLSAALLEVAEAHTVSAHLGESLCTVDVDRAAVPAELLARAEDRVNVVVEEDRPVRLTFPSPEELARLPLRRTPKVSRGVRVVDIGGFDVVPCGGTHCTSTAQVGLLKVLAAERHKHRTRVTFICGGRARALLSRGYGILSRLGRDWSCAPEDVPLVAARLGRDLASTATRLRACRDQLADELAARLSATSSEEVVHASLPDSDLELLRAVGRRLAAEGRVALLAAPSEAATEILAARGRNACFDCGHFVRAVADASGGHGGGRPDHAEGRLPPDVDWGALVALFRPHRPE